MGETIPIREGQQLMIRRENFNVLNHVNPTFVCDSPSGGFTPGFGEPAALAGSRDHTHPGMDSRGPAHYAVRDEVYVELVRGILYYVCAGTLVPGRSFRSYWNGHAVLARRSQMKC